MSENSKIGLLAVLLCVLAMLTVFRGCGGYGEVGSSAYEHAKALYAICNRQDADRLDLFSNLLQTAHTAGEVSEQEREWLEDIVSLAKAGDWKQATINARRLLKDQVKPVP